MLLVIAGIAIAFFVFRALGAQRLGGILRRAFWCGYILWAALVVYSLVYTPWKAIRAQDGPSDWQTVSGPSDASAKKANGGLHIVSSVALPPDAVDVPLPPPPPGYILDQPAKNEFGDTSIAQAKQAGAINSEPAAHGPAPTGKYTLSDLAPTSEQPTQPSPIQWEWAIGLLAGPLVLYRMVVFVVQG